MAAISGNSIKRYCSLPIFLALLVVLQVLASASAASSISVVNDEVVTDFPIPIVIHLGLLTITDINFLHNNADGSVGINATASIAFADYMGRDITFFVTGDYAQGGMLDLSGTQIGTWAPSAQGPNLDFLALSYKPGFGMISGGVNFGEWSLVAQIDFLGLTQPAFGLISTNQNSSASFSQLPGAPPVYQDIDPLSNAAIVISSYDGTFTFTTGASFPVIAGINIWGQSQWRGNSVTWTGQFVFSLSGGSSAKITGEIDHLNLGADLVAEDPKIMVQWPAEPTLTISTTLHWTQITIYMQGTISNTDINLQGDEQGPVPIHITSSTPIILSSLTITLDHSFVSNFTQATLTATMSYGTLPTVTVEMQYPADTEEAGCFALVVSLGASPSAYGLGDIAETTKPGSSSLNMPSQISEIWGTKLESFVFSALPNCGVIYVEGVMQTQSMGTVTAQFAAQVFWPISDLLESVVEHMEFDPQVPVDANSGITAPASSILLTLAAHFEPTGITIPESHVAGQSLAKALAALQPTLGALPQQVLFNITEYNIVVNAQDILPRVASAVSGRCPSSVQNATTDFAVVFNSQNVYWSILPDVKLSLPSFAAATASFQIQIISESFIANQGLNFVAEIDVSQSTASWLAPLQANLACPDQVYQIQGVVNNQLWQAIFQMPSGCLAFASDSVELSSTSIQIQSTAPQLSIMTNVKLPNAQELTFTTGGTFNTADNTTSIALQGATTSTYALSSFKEPVIIDSLSMNIAMNLGSSSSFQGSFQGAITLNNTEEIFVSTSLASSPMAASFDARIHYDNPVYLTSVCNWVVGPDFWAKNPLLPKVAIEKLTAIELVEAEFGLSTSPASLQGNGQFELFHELLASFSLSFANAKLAFAFSVSKNPESFNFKLSDFLPSTTALDHWLFSQPAFAAAEEKIEMLIPDIPQPILAETGLTFQGLVKLNETDPMQAQLSKWFTKAAEAGVFLRGLIDPTGLDFDLSATVNLTSMISPGLELEQAQIYIGVHPSVPGGLSIGIASDFVLALSSRGLSSDSVSFSGDLGLSLASSSASASLTAPWVNPFGTPGLTLTTATLDLELGPAFIPSSIGVSGSATLSSGPSGQALLHISSPLDLTHGTAFGVAFENLNLKDVAGSICSTGDLGTLFSSVSMTKAEFSINMGVAVTIDGTVFPSGLYMAVQNIDVGGVIQGSASLQIDPTKGVAAECDFHPFSLGSVFTVSDATGTFDAMVGKPFELDVHGQLTLLNTVCVVNIGLVDGGVQADIQFSSGVLDFTLDASTTTTDPLHPVDLTVAGELNIGPWLAQQLPALAAQTKNQLAPQEQDIQNQINSWQAQIDKLNQEIASRSANDTAAKQAAEAEVQKAQDAVTNAQNQVNNLNGDIEQDKQSLANCKSYDLTCKAKYEAEIVTLQATLATADAALSAAQYLLQQAQDALQKIPDPDVDPTIIEWKAEVLSLQGLQATAEGTLATIEAIMNVASQVVTAGSSALATDKLHFTISSYLGLSQNQAGNVELHGNFLGKSVDINVSMLLTDVNAFANAVWKQLQKL